MPCTKEATEYFLEKGVLVGPAKAANAGGVATSAIEMSQNSMRYYYTFEEVDTEYAKAIEKGVRFVLKLERVNISGTAVGASGMVAGVIVRRKRWYF